MGDIIFEQKEITSLEASDFDGLWSAGWRHFGPHFFRYNLTIHEDEICHVLPLRIRLKDYQHRKSHRKALRRAKGFEVVCRPLNITDEMTDLFERHKQRFRDNIPDSLEVFLSETPAVPRLPLECCIYDQERLIAASFFDESARACSSIYGMFDLEYGKYRLGLITMLEEINYARQKGKDFYYHGYCYNVSSFYDYKKHFPALEAYNWEGAWFDYGPDTPLPSEFEDSP